MKITKFENFFTTDFSDTLTRISKKDITPDGTLFVPKGVRFIGSLADNAKLCRYNVAEKIKKIVLPETVVRINYSAFKNFSSLEEINIPNSLYCIQSCAFNWCVNLKTIHFAEATNLQEYDSKLFSGTKIKRNFNGYYKVLILHNDVLYSGADLNNEPIEIAKLTPFEIGKPTSRKDGLSIYTNPLIAVSNHNSILTDKYSDFKVVLCECEVGNLTHLNTSSSCEKFVDEITVKRIIPREEIISMIFGKECKKMEKTE